MIEKMLQALTLSDSLSCGEVTYLAVVTFVSIFAIRKLVSKIFTPPAEPTEIPKDTSKWDSLFKAYQIPPATDTPEPGTDPTEPVDDEASAVLSLITKIAPHLKHFLETQQHWGSDSDNDDSDNNEPEITPVEPVESEIRSLGADIKPESKIVEPEITPEKNS